MNTSSSLSDSLNKVLGSETTRTPGGSRPITVVRPDGTTFTTTNMAIVQSVINAGGHYLDANGQPTTTMPSSPLGTIAPRPVQTFPDVPLGQLPANLQIYGQQLQQAYDFITSGQGTAAQNQQANQFINQMSNYLAGQGYRPRPTSNQPGGSPIQYAAVPPSAAAHQWTQNRPVVTTPPTPPAVILSTPVRPVSSERPPASYEAPTRPTQTRPPTTLVPPEVLEPRPPQSNLAPRPPQTRPPQNRPTQQTTIPMARPPQQTVRPTGASPSGNTTRPTNITGVTLGVGAISSLAELSAVLNTVASTMDLELVAINAMGFASLNDAIAHATELGFFTAPNPHSPIYQGNAQAYIQALLQAQIAAIQQMGQHYGSQGIYNIQAHLNQSLTGPPLGTPQFQDTPPRPGELIVPPQLPSDPPPFSEINRSLSSALQGESVGMATEQMIETGGPLLVVSPDQHESGGDAKVLDGIETSLAEQKLPMSAQTLGKVTLGTAMDGTATTTPPPSVDPSAAVLPSPVPPIIPMPPPPTTLPPP